MDHHYHLPVPLEILSFFEGLVRMKSCATLPVCLWLLLSSRHTLFLALGCGQEHQFECVLVDYQTPETTVQ